MKKFFGYIGTAFKWFWQLLSFTRQLVLNLLFIVFVIAFFLLISDSLPKKQHNVMTSEKPRALLINLNGPIVEKNQPIAPFDFASRNLFAQRPAQENLLFEIVDLIRYAAKDSNINGIILQLSDLPETNLTKLRYIAKALNEFKAAGKKIIASGGFYSQSQYYLASYADEIYMAPDGAVLLQGYGAYRLYYKELLEKLAITTHVFRVGEYKSAVEPYIASSMSPEAKQNNEAWLNSLWRAYVEDVAKNRNLTTEQVSPNANRLIALMKEAKGDTAMVAKKLGLVDALLTRQQIQTKLAELFGSDGKDSTNFVSIYDYKPSMKVNLPKENEIAVIVASGVIVDGLDAQKQIGGDSTAELLRKARLNNKIKAVILRIDSPGGSAFASEVIRNEIDALKNAGKPVVASMSSVAASGGYWIASSANKIIAEPTTITGSIGIFGLLTTFDKTLAKYGIYNDGLGTTPLSGVGLTRELPSFANELMQLGIEHGYQRFISLVSTERSIAPEKMDGLAQGRVWTGKDALEKNLIDKLGDFDDAIKVAADLAELDDFDINWLREQLTPAEQFILEFFSNTLSKLGFSQQVTLPIPFADLTNKAREEITRFSAFNDPNGQYVLCQECVIY